MPILPLARSLESNGIGNEGASALAAILKETMISNLKCAASPRVFAFVSAPVDTFANTSFLPCTYLRQQASTSRSWPLLLPPYFLHAFRILIHATLPSIVRREASSCRVGGSRVLPYTHLTPVRPPRRSLSSPCLDDQTKQIVKDAAYTERGVQLVL